MDLIDLYTTYSNSRKTGNAMSDAEDSAHSYMNRIYSSRGMETAYHCETS